MRSNLRVLVSLVAVMGLVTVGCAGRAERRDDDDTTPSTTRTLTQAESQLYDDDAEADQADRDVELGVEEPLSGAQPSEPGNTPTEETDLMTRVRTNPGLFFRPAGCITTTI